MMWTVRRQRPRLGAMRCWAWTRSFAGCYMPCQASLPAMRMLVAEARPEGDSCTREWFSRSLYVCGGGGCGRWLPSSWVDFVKKNDKARVHTRVDDASSSEKFPREQLAVCAISRGPTSIQPRPPLISTRPATTRLTLSLSKNTMLEGCHHNTLRCTSPRAS